MTDKKKIDGVEGEIRHVLLTVDNEGRQLWMEVTKEKFEAYRRANRLNGTGFYNPAAGSWERSKHE